MTNEFVAKDSIYTVKEIAQILRISERSAYNFINKTTDFKVLRIGRCLRVYRDILILIRCGNTKDSAAPANGTALYLHSLKSKIPCTLECQISFIPLHEHPVFLSGHM